MKSISFCEIEFCNTGNGKHLYRELGRELWTFCSNHYSTNAPYHVIAIIIINHGLKQQTHSRLSLM